MTGHATWPPLVAPGPELTAQQKSRYSRHLLMPSLGESGQRRLLAARVLVVGAGGLGSPALLYLVGAGVGRVTVIDDDVVDVTNLHRQALHGTAALGESKVDSARRRLADLNPDVEIRTVPERLTRDTVDEVLADNDLVIDGADNFDTRYVVSDACERAGKPHLWAAVFRTGAQLSTFWSAPPSGLGVTLRDLFPDPPNSADVPACADAGVLGPVVGQAGSMLATEAIKLICGIGQPVFSRVLYIDGLATTTHTLALAPRKPRHSRDPSNMPRDGHAERSASSHLGTGTLSPTALSERLTQPDPPLVLDVREPAEFALGMIPGAVTIPLGELPQAIIDGRLPRASEIVVHCKTGPRAAAAAGLLLRAGYRTISLLEGGMLAWIDQIDPSLPRY